MIKIRRALISVSDKKNILELAKVLKSLNIEIVSTGGTASLLKDNVLIIETSVGLCVNSKQFWCSVEHFTLTQFWCQH